MKVSDIQKGTFLNYYNWRKKVNSTTNEDIVTQEYSMIRMFIKYCHREGLTDISADKIEIRSFDRDKLQRNFGRDTFTEEEWETLYKRMKSFCAKKL